MVNWQFLCKLHSNDVGFSWSFVWRRHQPATLFVLKCLSLDRAMMTMMMQFSGLFFDSQCTVLGRRDSKNASPIILTVTCHLHSLAAPFGLLNIHRQRFFCCFLFSTHIIRCVIMSSVHGTVSVTEGDDFKPHWIFRFFWILYLPKMLSKLCLYS